VIEFNPANQLPSAVYSVDNYLGGNTTVHVAAGNIVLIGGAGNNWIYGGTGDDVIFGAGGKVTWTGNTEMIESIDLPFGGDDFLSGGGGRNIMIGGIGNTAFVGNFNTDIMIGRFAYIVIVNGRVTQVACFWFGDDPLAGPLSSVYSAENESGGSGTQSSTPPIGLIAGRTGTGSGAGTGTGSSTNTFSTSLNTDTSNQDLQGQQQQQSSHPGSSINQGSTSGQSGSTTQSGQQSTTGQDQPTSGSGQQQQQSTQQGGQSTSPPGQGTGQGQPPSGDGSQQGDQSPQGDSQGMQETDVPVTVAGNGKGKQRLDDGLVAFGAAIAAGARKDVLLDRDGFKRLKEERKRSRFLPWFGGKVIGKGGERMGMRK
jgi:hypothetical protein